MNVMENNYMFRPVLAIIRLSMELKFHRQVIKLFLTTYLLLISEN